MDLKSSKNIFVEMMFILNKNYNEYLDASFGKYDLTATQGLFLFKLDEFPDTTQKDLAKHFSLSKGWVAKYFIDLENKGFIRREKIQNDKRQYKITLTSKTIDLLPDFKKIIYDWNDQVCLDELGDDFMNKFSMLVENSFDVVVR
ncbi:MAG: MarR family transcriptional regulator [Methanobrevibacter sp.]|nr:MarR family transcriptional regulator [Methanobrevibacter sp.]